MTLLIWAILPLLDVLALSLAFVLGYEARKLLPFFPVPKDPPEFVRYLPILAVHLFVNITLFYVTQIYHQRRLGSLLDMLRVVVGTFTVGTLMTSALQEFIFKNSIWEVDYPRGMFFYIWVFSLFFLILVRIGHRQVLLRWRRRGLIRDNLLVIGTGTNAQEIIHFVVRTPALGYRLVGVVSNPNKLLPKGRFANFPVLGHYEQLPELIDHLNIEQVIVALPPEEQGKLMEVVGLCRRNKVDVKIFPDLFTQLSGDVTLDDFGGKSIVTVRDIALRGWRLSLKRAMDIIGACTGLLIFSPFMLLTGFYIRFQSSGRVFLIQERMGLDGRPFPMIKFRSMREDKEGDSPGWTVENDPRVTRFGRVLRRTSWDEMPQLINVLFGHMSLVGPRPEQPYFVQQFRERIPRYMDRHQEKAGMTGWAQVNGLRGDTSIKERTRYDLWYVEHWSLWLDFKIILRTIVQILMRSSRNAY